MFTTVRLINTSFTLYTYCFVDVMVIKLKLHFHKNFSLYNTILFTTAIMLYSGFPRTYSSYNWKFVPLTSSFQLLSCSVALCDPRDCSTPGLPVHHQLLEFTQTHVHQVADAIQPSHPLLSPSHPTFNLSQHQGLFKWVSSSHQVAKVLEFQHQSFQWIFRTDFL